MLQGVQSHASSDRGSSRTGGENDFDLRRIKRDVMVRNSNLGAVRVCRVHGDAELRSGVGGGKEDVLLQAALRRDGWRNAAESNITGFDNGDGGPGNESRIHLGVRGGGA